jgi:hypothetical protein
LIVGIHQPQYLPWLGYFDKMDQADAFVFLDNVQFKKNEWQNRNRIKTAQGRQWLTVPVIHRFPQQIDEVVINNRVNWRHKHFQALQTNYAKAPYFGEYIDFFKAVYAKKWEHLADLNIFVIKNIYQMLGFVQKPMILASTLDLRCDPNGRLIDIVKTFQAETYLAGKGGGNYMHRPDFEARGINVIVQQFEHPVYPQLYGCFQPNLSIIDLMFNCGPQSREIIRHYR